MEALFLVLIGAVLFSQSWQLLGLYSDTRTTGLLMMVLGVITVLGAISASLYEPTLLTSSADMATETMVMKVVIVSWGIYAIVGGAQYLWDFDERASGFYSGFIAITTFFCMIYFATLLQGRYGVETWEALSGATLILSLIAGFNLSCVGDNGPFTLISSIEENTYADKIALRVMRKRKKFKNLSFLYRGSNERQFGCQNLNLPFVTICRSRFGDYKEYHTSDDNLNLINGNNLFDSLKCVLEIVNEIQNNNIYIKKTICEPFLTKYNLVKTIGFGKFKKEEKNIRNIISYVGKNYDLIDISKKLKIPFNKLNLLIKNIEMKKIIKKYL